MKDNKGFSLIELMVVLCIAALLISGTAISMKILDYADSKYCAREIDTALDQLRLDTMSKSDKKLYLVLEWDNTQQEYYMSYASANVELNLANWKTEASARIKNRKKIANRKITLSYTTDGSSFTDLRETNSVILLSFIPNSGAFCSSFKEIKMTSGVKTSSVIMVSQTGNHYIK